MISLKRYRVLYAEDNEDACFMVTTMLGFSGIEVITAKSIAEAWQLAQTGCFDLYLLDSRFPDGSGLDLCRHLREYAPHTPVLFYSGDASENNVQDGLAAGACDYLTKPYFPDLNVTIKRTIEQTKNSAQEFKINFVKAKSASPDYRNDTLLITANPLNY